VESGVDLDFPVVYRALAGFDSIAHAAGLCNREGRMGDTGSQGRMVVFQVPSDILPDTLAKRQEAGLQTFHCFADLAKSLHPDVYTAYYRILYHRVPSFDEKNIMGLLAGPNAAPIIDGSGFQIQFNSASGRLQCTDQANSLPVVVGYRAQAVQDAPELEGIDLVSQWEEKGPDRKILQLLQGFIVLVPEDMVHGMTKKGLLRPVRFLRDVYVQAVRMAESPKTPFYDPIRGLRLDLSACRV
jgi:CRISPR-associated endonuclease/helicase Cas3